MDESSPESSGARQSQQPEAAKTPTESNESSATSGGSAPHQVSASDAKNHKLPVVWSPKLDASDDIWDETPHPDAAEAAAAEKAAAKEGPSAAGPAPARSARFVLLAACVALAAAVGSFAGALSASGVAHVWPTAGTPVAMTEATGAQTMQALKAEGAQLSALKADLDNATRGANTQFAKISERLDHVEHAQVDPAKLAHVADAVDRLEKHNEGTPKVATAATPETTGSIASNQASASNEPKQSDKILRDWVVQDVRSGRALVESRYGAVFTVMAGSVLPGLGRVEAVKRQEGEWTVVTEHGTITSGQ